MEAENPRLGHSSKMVRPNDLKLSKNYLFIQIKNNDINRSFDLEQVFLSYQFSWPPPDASP